VGAAQVLTLYRQMQVQTQVAVLVVQGVVGKVLMVLVVQA
jgi:hypothetical protein